MLQRFVGVLILLLCSSVAAAAHAVEMQPVPAQKAWQNLEPAELEELVGPIALYPDDLVAIVLPASTFPLQVVQAARFREQTPDGTPSDRWDSSVVALLNYPEVLKKLNDDLDWTWRLGEAVINQQPDVLQAVSVFRERARVAGNLKSDERQIVEVREKIVYIRPVSERVIYVPYYDPWQMTSYHRNRVYHYYPQPYPVYYYPYDDYWDFPTSRFWGVSSWYGIGWQQHRVHWLHHQYRHHPYYGRSYRDHGRHRRYRHQAAPAWVNNPPPPAAADGVPVLPPDSVWQPGARAGSRPFGERRQHSENPVGEIRGQVPGAGGESSITVPQDIVIDGTTEGTPAGAERASPPVPATTDSGAPIAPVVSPDSTADSIPEDVVYDGNVNGERVRVIRRGSSIETTRAPESAAAPSVQDIPAQSGSVYGSGHEGAIERARNQSEELAETWRRQQDSQPDTRADTRVWRSDPVETRSAPDPVIQDTQPSWGTRTDPTEDSRWGGPVHEERVTPVIEAQREVIHEPAMERQGSRWGNEAAIQEAISRARDQGYGANAPREESRGSWNRDDQRRGWSEPSWNRESRDETREAAPAPSWNPEPRFEQPGFEPRQEERSEPAWQPERQEEIRIDDIRVEGQQ